MQHKISVIVPVYNREQTIERCLDSLLNQTYSNIEILAVNDGSSDQTRSILNRYGQQYPNKMIVIHTENQGVSMARNEGLKRMSGEYVGFVDSDDYIAPDMYEVLMKKALKDDLDLVGCQTLALYPDKELRIDSKMRDNQSTHQLLIDAYAVLWNKLYRRELLENLWFKKDVWYEDVLFLYQVYSRVKRIGSVSEIGYYYVQNEGSITYTYNEKLYQLLENLDDIIAFYKKNDLYDTYKAELEYTYVRYSYGTFIKRLAKAKDKKKFMKGCDDAIQHVRNQFPAYKQNPYLRMKNGKAYYLRYFNRLIAWLIYHREKNKMN